jgi:hypothetical protein
MIRRRPTYRTAMSTHVGPTSLVADETLRTNGTHRTSMTLLTRIDKVERAIIEIMHGSS